MGQRPVAWKNPPCTGPFPRLLKPATLVRANRKDFRVVLDESCGAESSSSDATSSCEDKAKETPSCSDKSCTEKSEATPANPSCSEQTPADSCCPKPTSPKTNDKNPTRACEPGPCSQGKPGDDPKGPSCSETRRSLLRA